MKNQLLVLLLFGTFTILTAQTVPVKTLRLQNATTVLAQNIPVGTHVYNMDSQRTYVATIGVATGETLTTAAASFKLVSENTVVTDNLTSTEAREALSANQGRLLQENKLDNTLADTNIFVGNGTADATAVALGGDATLANNGTLTIADNAVDGTDISLTGEAQGDMAYFNGTDWVRLPKGTANQSLVMNPTATAPQWQSGPSRKQFISVGITNEQPISGDHVDVEYNIVRATSNDINFNRYTGVFTLQAGKTYMLEAYTAASPSNGTNNADFTLIAYEWVDANTNVSLQSGSRGIATLQDKPSSAANYEHTPAKLIYTPSVNQNVKVRITYFYSGGYSLIRIRSEGAKAFITEL